jgi:hypothetical protein
MQPRLLGVAAVVAAGMQLTGCNVTIQPASSGKEGALGAAATPTPSSLHYAVCQLGVNGHNVRVTVGGAGVTARICSGLLPDLGSQLGWSISTTPAPTLPTNHVICAIPQSLLPRGDRGVVTDAGYVGTTDGSDACTALATASTAGPCPPPITGEISGAGNRIPLTVEIVNPASGDTVGENAILDTGGIDEVFPDDDLRNLGFSPSGTETESLAGWSGTANVYTLPAEALRVLDAGMYVPIATGTLTVYGVPGAALSGLSPIVGLNVLQQGAKLSSSGSQWSLTPACPG